MTTLSELHRLGRSHAARLESAAREICAARDPATLPSEQADLLRTRASDYKRHADAVAHLISVIGDQDSRTLDRAAIKRRYRRRALSAIDFLTRLATTETV